MDQRIKEILEKEEQRQKETIELIASENFASDAVRELSGSVFTNKYAEGYPGRRYYNGCDYMDEIELYAQEKCKELFGYKHVNVQPHSGANANLAVMNAILKPGDKIVSMDLASGGHLSHGSSVNISGKLYECHTYGVDMSGKIDYDFLDRLVQLHKPRLLIAGASAYPLQIEWDRLQDILVQTNRQATEENMTYLLADIAHYSGLIAGGAYQGPGDIADFVTSTTHKTLRGPRGGIIMWNDDKFTKKINSSVFPGTQGGPLMNQIAAKAQCFVEALTPEFKEYAQQVVKNANVMMDVFRKTQITLQCQTYGTDSHIVLINLTDKGISGKDVADALEKEGITVNKNSVPLDPLGPTETSGIRIGTAAETTRGMTEQDFYDLAFRISDIIYKVEAES